MNMQGGQWEADQEDLPSPAKDEGRALPSGRREEEVSFVAESCQGGYDRANTMTGLRGKAHAPSFANRWHRLQTKIAPC